MKIVLSQNKLYTVLQYMSGPTIIRQNLPILNSVFLETTKNQLKLTTTNLDITILAFLDVNILTPGKILLPFKQFFSTIRELPSQEITLELVKNNLLIKCEKIEIEINTFNIDEFPKLEYPKETLLIKINPYDLLSIIKLTSFCVGHEDTSYILNGILFEVQNNTIKGISTDGKRLAVAERKLSPHQPELKNKLKFILSFKTVNEIQRILKDKEEEIYFYIEGNKVGFDLNNLQIITRPMEGEFPPYEEYIPPSQQEKLQIKRNLFLSSLKRAALLSTPEHQGVILELKKNEIIIQKITPQIGKIKDKISCSYNGKSFSIGFNPYYLIDVLKNIEEEDVFFEFFDVDKPAVLRMKDYVYLVLPMRI